MTEIVQGKSGGESMLGLRGHALDGTRLVVRPPDVPADVPNAKWWTEHKDHFDAFRPLPMDPHHAMPHIRLDAALEFLLADRLR